MKIGVFDSGIGGLTVLKRLIKKFPNNEYIYYGDTKNVPYGDKSIEELKVLSSNIINFLIEKEVDMIVIACGTISSNLSTYLKEKYNIRIIDIISPVIDYLNNSNYEKIGVIATQATINSKIFSKNLNKEVKEVACPKFVPLIESNNFSELENYYSYYLDNLKDRDLIVLGCTHYPIIKKEISEYLGNNIKLLDMAECINDIKNDGISRVELYFSKLDDKIVSNVNSILKDKKYIIKMI
ncbi:MAG: glutamate racemase [Firmicutes bacterium]|nr:glutamate racemase [Bacillota bacterium]